MLHVSQKSLVSVVMPTYNRESLIRRAIHSVLKQTYQNFELIIIDDCSTDNTVKVVKSFNDKRIKYIRHDFNKGGSASRNTGIKYSSGEYIAFLDSDDEWLPDKLKKQIGLFLKSNSNTGLVYCWSINVFGDKKDTFLNNTFNGNIYKELVVRNYIGSTSCAVVHRSVFNKIEYFDENLAARQDLDLWLRLSEYFDVNCVPEYLVKVYHHKGLERISVNNNGVINGREYFFQKHRRRIYSSGCAHKFLCLDGQFYRNRFFDLKKSRDYFLMAIRYKPLYIYAYVLYLSTFIPQSTYFSLRKAIKTKINLCKRSQV